MADHTSTMKSLYHIVGSRSSSDLSMKTVAIPTPNFAADEHLIQVRAVAPCASELTWHTDHPFVALPTREPVPCYEFSGTVIAAPSGSPFQPGAEVYARTNAQRTGVARQYAIALTRELAIKPKNLSWTEAASVSLSALTAWQALFIKSGVGNLKDESWKEKSVCVTAAAGGVGAWLVQLARLAGAEVLGTCGPDNIDFVSNVLGANHVVNYKAQSLTQWCVASGKKFDIVVDCVGGSTLVDAWGAVKEGGVLMSIVLPVDFSSGPVAVKPPGLGENVNAFYFVMEPNGAQLAEITRLLEEKKVRTFIDSVYALEDFAAAFTRLDSGHARGKVVLRLE